MTYNYFKKTIELIVSMYDEKIEFEKKLEKVFGGDTRIISELFDKKIETMIENLAKELNDKDKWIDYLVFEVLMSPCSTDKKEFTIVIDGKEKIANTKTIWEIINEKK